MSEVKEEIEKIQKNIFVTKKEKIDYKWKKICYFNKTGFRRHNWLLSVFAVLYRFFATWFFYLVWIAICIAFFVFDLKYEVFDKKDLFAFIDSKTAETLFDTSITLFGIMLTAYSIVFVFKNKNFLRTNQFENAIKYAVFPTDIKTLMGFNVFYLGWNIVSLCVGNAKAASFALSVSCFFTIWGIVKISMKTNAQIYYNNNSKGLKPNPFKRRKSNYLELVKKVEEKNKNKEMIVEFLTASFNNKYMVNTIRYFKETSRIIVYKNETEKEFDFELFKTYISEYFNHINCDSQIVGSSFICILFVDVLEKLYNNKMYEFYAVHSNSFLDGYLKFVSSKLINNRFIKPSDNLIDLDVKMNGNISKVILRNYYFIVIMKASFDVVEKSLKEMQKEENKNFYSNADVENIKKKIDKINKYLNDYSEQIKNSADDIVEKRKERKEKVQSELKKINEINTILNSTKNKIRDILNNN